jgi:hypothetical protein
MDRHGMTFEHRRHFAQMICLQCHGRRQPLAVEIRAPEAARS